MAGVCQRTYLVHSTYVFFCTRATIYGKIVKPTVHFGRSHQGVSLLTQNVLVCTFWTVSPRCLTLDTKCTGTFWAVLTGLWLRPVLAAYRNFFSCFFFSSHVGIVPEGNLMAIFVCDWRCKFLLKFWFVTEKKFIFCRNNFVGPRSPKTIPIICQGISVHCPVVLD
jgi:hypothetical protein